MPRAVSKSRTVMLHLDGAVEMDVPVNGVMVTIREDGTVAYKLKASSYSAQWSEDLFPRPVPKIV